MNYIKQLQADLAKARQENELLRKGIGELQEHLNLPKFSCGDRLDGYINIADVRNSLRETLHNAIQ